MHGEASSGFGEHGQWLNALQPYIPEWADGFVDPVVITGWLIIALLVVLAYMGSRHLRSVPRGVQNVWEFFIEAIQGLCVEMIGPGGERFAPFITTIFLYVFFNALVGLIPGFAAPAATLNGTFAPALVVFFAVQYFGFKEHGVRYLKHFTGDVWLLAPVLFIVHLIGELAKPLSLAVRLFGNTFGDDTLVAEFIRLSAEVMKAIWVPLPFQLPFLFLAMFIAFIQAVVFVMLTCAYINMATGHEEEHEEDRSAHEIEQTA